MAESCRTSAKCQIISIVIGIILIVFGVSMIFIVRFIEFKEVIKNVVLSENSSSIAYSFWKEPKLPIHLQFYIFNLKNPDEVMKGAKPVLEQKGPYTYREHVKKEDIEYHPNHTVSYRQVKSWHFDLSKSVGNDSDMFTTANIPLLTLVESLRWEDPFVQEGSAFLLKIFSEKLFITKTVREIVWGYQDELLAAGKILVPSWIYSDFLGIYSGRNNTYDGLYSIFTGESDYKKLGLIDTFNQSHHVNFWTTNQSNLINGSDGTIGAPFMSKKKIVYSFVSDICRSIYALYEEESRTPYDITVWRYSGPRQAFQSGRTNPANSGFCTPRGNCLGDGLLNMTECRMFDHFHVPIIASLPHFYMADKKYLHAVEGLSPIPEQHRTDLFIEPKTGLPLRIFKRLQVNIYIQSNKYVSEMGNVSSLVFPMLWLNESVVVDDENLRQLSQMLILPLTVATVVQYLLLALGTLLVLVTSLLWLYFTWKRENRNQDITMATDDSRALIT